MPDTVNCIRNIYNTILTAVYDYVFITMSLYIPQKPLQMKVSFISSSIIESMLGA